MQALVTKGCFIFFGLNPILTIVFYSLIISIVYLISKKIKFSNLFLFLISISPIIIWLLRLILNDYFLSDDFDHFVLVNKYSYWQIFIKGVMADNLWAFHRLFTAFEVFKLINYFFETNYYAFVVFNGLIHILNAYLLLLVLKKAFNQKYIIFISIFIYSTFYLTWISNIHELLAGFFFLLTFNLLLNNKNSILTVVSFVLGIYSKEIVFLLPVCYLLFLKFLHNFKEKVNFKKELTKILPIIFVSLIYLVVFMFDYLKLMKADKGSGYDLLLMPNNLFNHLAFYVNDVLPFISGTVGLIILSSVIFIHDFVKKKLILVPLYLSYLVLIFPVLSLSKNTSYYNYIPFIFIIFILAYLFNYFRKTQIYLAIFLTSVLLVSVFKSNIDMQENCFLIQFSRESARRSAVERILKGEIDNNNEARWFVENNYLPYFK